MRRQAGFTLIELLCALTILALVLAVSLRILSNGNRSAALTRDYGRALAVAQTHLALMQSAERLEPGERSGNDAGIAWREQMTVTHDAPFAEADAALLLAWRLDSTAQLPDGRTVHLGSVRLERKP
jgi:general secretion pathway protein I